jgi:FkbM family methyltransferase
LLELARPNLAMSDIKGLFFKEPIEKYFLGHLLSEVYKELVYQPYLGGKKDLTIVEIGANIGVSTYYFSRVAKRVVSVEPSKNHFELLKKMVEFNELKNVDLINKAVFINKGMYDFGGPDGNDTMKSMHSAVWQGGRPTDKVEAITLEDLFDDNKIEHCDFMNVDVEGSEYELFANEHFLKVADRIQTIMVERHAWAGRNPQQLVDSLIAAKFKVYKVPSEADILIARHE